MMLQSALLDWNLSKMALSMNFLRPFAALSSSLLLLCAGLASCSKDADSSARGERLPEGRYPIEFTVEEVEIEPFTRATVDGDWDGVESVAVWIYSRGNDVKRYSVTSTDGGKTAKLTSDDPLFWEYNGDWCGVMAWYPYSDSYPSAWIVKADQSAVENYRASDFVEGRNSDLSFAERNDPSKNKITFVHRTSKIVVNLVAGPGVILGENTSVKLLNVGRVETGNTVTAYRPDAAKQSFHALLAGRQTITAGAPFIQVNVGSNVFVYTPSTGRPLIENTSYTYTVTVKAHGIEVAEAIGGEWTDGGSEDVASISITHYTTADLKIGDYYYSDGTWSDGGLRKLYSDGTMTMENPKPAPVSGKTVIGIVFHVGQHPNDNSDYSGSGIGQKKCQGYAVALTDATTGYCVWGEYGTKLDLYIDGNYSNLDIDWSGYNYTQTIIKHVGGKDKLNAGEQPGYPATYYAVVAYEDDCPAPTNSSGWFLPSIGQMLKVYQQRNLLSYVDGSSLKDDDYWSSSEDYEEPEYYAIFLNVYKGFVYGGIKNDCYCYVRAILAF